MKRILLFMIVVILALFTLSACEIIGGTGKDPAGEKGCEHIWAEATCLSPKTCTNCGESVGGTADHDYSEATCTSAQVCKTCGIWYGLPLGHDYADANCTDPQICKVCGSTKGEPVHDYADATCTDPMICKKCGAQGGNSLGHKLNTVVTDATCTADGAERTSCSVCGEVIDNVVIPKIEHAELSFIYNNDATATVDGTLTAACPCCDYAVTKKLAGSAALIREAFAGKKISGLGDSISTYLDITSGVAADTTNSTIRNNIVWNGYRPTNPVFGGTSVDSTWWQMTINALGATRLVNNSHSGKSVFQAVNDSCMQLHDDTGDNAGETPDIIFVYLGTNDNNRTMGYPSQLRMSEIEKLAKDDSYSPKNLAEAYAVMLYRIKMTYPDAEIYCLTNLERSDMAIELTHAVSSVIRNVADLFEGVYVADIANESGVTRDNPDYEIYMPRDTGNKCIHPGAKGMEKIYSVVLKTVIENSRYVSEDFEALLAQNL